MFKSSKHAKDCPQFSQQPNAENGGAVIDTAFSCNCSVGTQASQALCTASIWKSPFNFPGKDGEYLVVLEDDNRREYRIGSFHRQNENVGHWFPSWGLKAWMHIPEYPETTASASVAAPETPPLLRVNGKTGEITSVAEDVNRKLVEALDGLIQAISKREDEHSERFAFSILQACAVGENALAEARERKQTP